MSNKITVSNGELVDKYTILKIKMLFKPKEVLPEYTYLSRKVQKIRNLDENLVNALSNVNLTLWNLEDRIRLLESNQDFGEEFVEVARNIYKCNDERHALKRSIDETTSSKFKEVKVLPQY